MTIQQTIDIPADRRVVFDLPETAPTGSVDVTLRLKAAGKSSGADIRLVDWVLHPIQTYRYAGWKKLIKELKEYREVHGPLFGGMDGLEYQRMIRSEWVDRF
jgi:hypothetical protein